MKKTDVLKVTSLNVCPTSRVHSRSKNSIPFFFKNRLSMKNKIYRRLGFAFTCISHLYFLGICLILKGTPRLIAILQGVLTSGFKVINYFLKKRFLRLTVS